MARFGSKRRRDLRRTERANACASSLRGPASRARLLRPAIELLEERRLLATTPFAQITMGLDSRLTSLQSQLTSALNQLATGTHSIVPILGSKAGDAAATISRISQPVHDALTALSSTMDYATPQLRNSAIQLALANALGDAGHVHILVDRNGNGANTDDVSVTGTDPSGAFEVDMRLDVTIASTSTTASFNTGLPGLPVKISANGGVQLSVGAAFELAFSFSGNANDPVTHGVMLDDSKKLTGLTGPVGSPLLANPNAQLALFVTAGLSSGFNAVGTIGFVQGNLTIAKDQHGASEVNALNLTITADHLSTTRDIALDGVATANLQMTASLAGGSADFPSINSQFHLLWDLGANTAPQVWFDNVNIDLGQFMHNVLDPVLTDIHSVIDPIEPILQVLNYRLPVLSDLSNAIGDGDVTLQGLLSVAAQAAGLGPIDELFNLATTLITDIAAFPTSAMINLGGFAPGNSAKDDTDLRDDSNIAGNISDLSQTKLSDLIVDTNNVANAPVNGLDGYSSVVTDKLKQFDNPAGDLDLDFPILTDPKDAVFAMLLGQNSDLVKLTAHMHVQATEDSGISAFGLGVDFGGEIDISGNLIFAYDTFGLRELINDIASGDPNRTTASNIASDIGDGFYFDDTSNFSFGGNFHVGASVSLGIAHAGVDGYVGTGVPAGDVVDTDPITLTIADPNGDGKLRFSEFNLQNFKLGGSLDAGLNFEIQVGVDTPFGFLGYKKNFDIAHIKVYPPGDPPPSGYVLASNADDNTSPAPGDQVVQLYTGQDSIRRHDPNGGDIGGPDGTDASYVIEHVGDDTDSEGGEIIKVEAYGFSQIIHHVKYIYGNSGKGDLTVDIRPGVEADVVLNGPLDILPPEPNLGHAYFSSEGTGTTLFTAGALDSTLSGGKGVNTLVGGPGYDTFIVSTPENFIDDLAGKNLIILEGPLGSFDLASGPNAYNTLRVVASKTTTTISAMPIEDELSVQIDNLNFATGGLDHQNIIVPDIADLVVDSQASAAEINIGDLHSINIQRVAIYEYHSTSVAGSDVFLDTPPSPDGSPSFLGVSGSTESDADPLDAANNITEVGFTVDDLRLGGTEVGVFGLSGGDTLTVRQHGGTTDIGDLGFSGGTIIFDSTNQSGFSETTTLTTPVRSNGSTVAINSYSAGIFGGLRIQAAGDPDIVTKQRPTDSTVVMVSAAPPGATNHVTVDASILIGALHVEALGPALAINNIVVSAVGGQGTVSIDGENTITSVTVGAGNLNPILGNVSVADSTLTIDDSASTSANIFALAGGSFVGWDTGLPTPPILTLVNLANILTINVGASDQFDLESTPANIAQLNIKNLTTARDFVYVAGAATHLVFDGDFRLSLGEHISPAGVVFAAKSFLPLANTSITFNFSSSLYAFFSPTVVHFADPGAQSGNYTIGGVGNLVVTNQTYGLAVTINDFRGQDGVNIDLAGGAVNADLTQTGPATFTVDGSARLAGANVPAVNSITAHVRAGAIVVLPTGPNTAMLKAFDTLDLVGSLPQDNFDVYDSNNVLAAANDPVASPFVQFMAAPGNPTSAIAGQPFDFTVVAADINGATLTSYTGQVQSFTYNQATQTYLASNYQSFTPADQGQHVFHLLLTDPGVYTLGFDDGPHTNSFTLNVIAPPVIPPPPANLDVDVQSIPVETLPPVVVSSDLPAVPVVIAVAAQGMAGPVAINHSTSRKPILLPSRALASHLAAVKPHPAKPAPRKPGAAKHPVMAPPQHSKGPPLKRNSVKL